FEPTPATVASLRRNVALNGLGNVVVNQAVVSAAPGTARLYLHPQRCNCNTIAAPHAGGTVIAARAVTLDGYAAAHGLAAVDVLKLDRGGAGVLALAGAGSRLPGGGAPVLVLEVTPPALARSGTPVGELRGLLAEAGYTCHQLGSYASAEGKYGNVLATK